MDEPKNFTQLTKDELVSLVYNNFNVGYNTTLECACCGHVGAQYYYQCQECQEKEKDRDDERKA